MTPSTMRRPGGRTARTTEAVFAAVLDEMASRSLPAVTFDAIATRSGVHRTTLYRRWGTPTRLVVDALTSTARDRLPIPDTGTLAGDLRCLADSVAAVLRDPRGKGVLLALLAGAHTTAELSAVLDEFWDQRRAAIQVIVRRATARGELSQRADPGKIFTTLVGPLYYQALVLQETLAPSTVRTSVDTTLTAVAAGVLDRGDG